MFQWGGVEERMGKGNTAKLVCTYGKIQNLRDLSAQQSYTCESQRKIISC